jgi:hypothetical protein
MAGAAVRVCSAAHASAPLPRSAGHFDPPAMVSMPTCVTLPNPARSSPIIEIDPRVR